jgi:hypothetical protein
MDFGTVVTDVLRYCGQGTGGDFERMVKVGVNSAYRDVLETSKLPHEMREFTITSVADSSQLGMPLWVKKIHNMEDPTTPRFVYKSTSRAFDKAYAGTTTTGTPESAYLLGVRGVQKHPNSDGKLAFTSSDNADSGAAYIVRVTGFNSSGNLVTEQVVLTGTSSKETDTLWDSTLSIERITKEPTSGKTFAGDITVKDDDANIIAVIPTWWDSPDYRWVEFYPTPSAAITYTVRAEMRKPPLVNDGDWPEFDQEYHDLLVWGTTKDMLSTIGKVETADRHRATYNERLRKFTGDVNDTPGAIWIFANVQTQAGFAQRPIRPQIQGVDFGLVS